MVSRIIRTRPPGWVGIDCAYCFGWTISSNSFIRTHCPFGCLPGGLKPPFGVRKGTTFPPLTYGIPITIIVTAKKTRTLPYTTPTKTTKTTSKCVFCKDKNTFSMVHKSYQKVLKTTNDTKDPKAFIWILVGILGGIIFVGFFVVSFELLGRLATNWKNKIGPTDVIIYQPDCRKNREVYVIT